MATTSPYDLRLSRDAIRQLRQWFSADEGARIRDATEAQLRHEPLTRTRNRKPFLRPNPYATWELRIGDLRVLYDVDDREHAVDVNAIGRKVGNRLLIDGEEIEL